MKKGTLCLTGCLAVAIACLLLGTTAGHADRKDGYKQEMERKNRGSGSQGKHEEEGPGHEGKAKRGPHGHKVEYRGDGPPPWAPAHGYRGRHEGGTPSPYAVPHRIDVGGCNRATVGAVVGGAAGGVLGSKVGAGMGKDAAIIAGTVIGVVVGGEIGRWMDDVDQACAAQTLEYAGGSRDVEWVNPDNGAVYNVIPTETYRTAEDRYCREYRAAAHLDGRAQEVYGTACREPDGSWRLVNR